MMLPLPTKTCPNMKNILSSPNINKRKQNFPSKFIATASFLRKFVECFWKIQKILFANLYTCIFGNYTCVEFQLGLQHIALKFHHITKVLLKIFIISVKTKVFHLKEHFNLLFFSVYWFWWICERECRWHF